MLTLHGCTRSRASRNIWLLEELGLPFHQVPVIQAGRVADPDAADAPLNTRSPAFLAVSALGKIPVLVDGALTLAESLAINLHLARGQGAPIGPADAAEDALFGMWALWAATEVEPLAIQILYHRAMRPPAQRDPAVADAAVADLRAPFAHLDAALAPTGFLVGGRFTVADLNTAEIVRYAKPAPELFADTRAINAWYAACQARPAFQRMWARREQEPA